MFEHKVSDLHMHLNGSFSLDFLEKMAKKNNAIREFGELNDIREKYNTLIQQETGGKHEKSIPLIWKQFSLIHKIIQTLDDIQEGTVNVIEHSIAKYMEIRTTPKSMGDSSWDKYVDAFVKGLKRGNEKYKDKKLACGLLSLDRTVHDEKMAYQIIDRVVSEKKDHGLLVGVDISGNPIAERKLTGDGLANVVRYALNQEIGIAIHIGEADTAIEKQDVDILLEVLMQWCEEKQNFSKEFFYGKVRLGHAIFLSEQQKSIIKELQIPIEICPSCHEKMNWWDVSDSHPIKTVYEFWNQPIATGTDDELIFGGDAKKENKRVLELFGYSEDEKKRKAREHQSKFRFS